jgi:hypothetical protein
MELTYPLQGKTFSVTSNFGQRNMGNHKGIDLKAESGTRVVAAASGRVIKADTTSDPNGYGGQVLIRHDADGNTFYTKYGHLRKLDVSKGDIVSKGEVIGESGGGKDDPNRGRSTGPHLHFELLDSASKAIDPTSYLKGATLLGGALLAGSTLTGGDKDSDDTDNTSTKSKSNVVDDIMGGFMKGYAPIAALASLKGVSTPQKESEIPKEIMKEIQNFKRLIK